MDMTKRVANFQKLLINEKHTMFICVCVCVYHFTAWNKRCPGTFLKNKFLLRQMVLLMKQVLKEQRNGTFIMLKICFSGFEIGWWWKSLLILCFLRWGKSFISTHFLRLAEKILLSICLGQNRKVIAFVFRSALFHDSCNLQYLNQSKVNILTGI